MPSERSIKLTIAALGGQGGGVLANWLIGIAESEGYIAQTTSVPGVAQRTGATIYYLEFFPQALAAAAGRDPIMALMPASGDVDCVLASELAEAARAIQRGLVTRDKTTLIASSHRSYAICERSAMGDGTADEKQLLDLVRTQAKRAVVFDMDAVAESHHSVISSVMLGALCGSGVLPFRKAAFEAAIKKGGIAVDTNLAAFEDAYQRADRGGDDVAGAQAGAAQAGGARRHSRDVETTAEGVLSDVPTQDAGSEPLLGAPERVEIRVVDHEPSWARRFETEAVRIRGALGDGAVMVEHIGSTSVPGLAAKPIIDICLVVEDSSDESTYVPPLEAAGYELRVREPDWHEHRMLRTPERDVHVHVFTRGSAQIQRHLAFRDRLRAEPRDRALYEATKRQLATREWETMQHYADAKTEVIETIMKRAEHADEHA